VTGAEHVRVGMCRRKVSYGVVDGCRETHDSGCLSEGSFGKYQLSEIRLWNHEMIRAIAGLGVIVLTACSDGSREEIRGSAWTAEPTMSIGSVEGADALASIDDIAVGDDGSIYVLQSLTHELTKFGADGVLQVVAGGQDQRWDISIGESGTLQPAPTRTRERLFTILGRTVRLSFQPQMGGQ
jgi:hypothetical protein